MSDFAIELGFDDELEERVRGVRRALLEAQIAMRSLYPRPHISLAVVGPGAGESDVVPAAAELVRGQGRFRVTLASSGCFAGGKGVVFLAPEPGRELLEAHAAVQTGLEARGVRVWPYYTPDQWVPHCTLAEDVEPQDLERAVSIAGAAGLPMQGWCERVGVAKVPSGEVVMSEGLGAG